MSSRNCGFLQTNRRFAEPGQGGRPAEAWSASPNVGLDEPGLARQVLNGFLSICGSRGDKHPDARRRGRHEAGTTSGSAIRAASCGANPCSNHVRPKVQGHRAAGGRGVSEHGFLRVPAGEFYGDESCSASPVVVGRVGWLGAGETGAPGGVAAEPVMAASCRSRGAASCPASPVAVGRLGWARRRLNEGTRRVSNGPVIAASCRRWRRAFGRRGPRRSFVFANGRGQSKHLPTATILSRSDRADAKLPAKPG